MQNKTLVQVVQFAALCLVLVAANAHAQSEETATAPVSPPAFTQEQQAPLSVPELEAAAPAPASSTDEAVKTPDKVIDAGVFGELKRLQNVRTRAISEAAALRIEATALRAKKIALELLLKEAQERIAGHRWIEKSANDENVNLSAALKRAQDVEKLARGAAERANIERDQARETLPYRKVQTGTLVLMGLFLFVIAHVVIRRGRHDRAITVLEDRIDLQEKTITGALNKITGLEKELEILGNKAAELSATNDRMRRASGDHSVVGNGGDASREGSGLRPLVSQGPISAHHAVVPPAGFDPASEEQTSAGADVAGRPPGS